MKKKCKFCKKEFEPNNHRRVYCSDECVLGQDRFTTREWQKANQERCNEKGRDWNKRHPETMKKISLRREVKDIEHQKVRRATRYKYGKPTKCSKCDSSFMVQYHHEKPYHVDSFVIVCRKCHLAIHGIFNSNSFAYKGDLLSQFKGGKNV